MSDEVMLGQSINISAPRNLFPLTEGMTSARLIAGGIGITPILAMARELEAKSTPFRLWYAGRNQSSMAFRNDIALSNFAAHATLHADEEHGGPLDLSEILAQPSANEHLYVCGPIGLIDAVLAMAPSLGWVAEHVHRESFSPAAPSIDDQPFQLRLARSNVTLNVPADRTALDVLLEHGVEVDSSCEQGVCGSCITTVLQGDPDHRDLYLSPEEQARNDCFTPCCSRARSRELVLDL